MMYYVEFKCVDSNGETDSLNRLMSRLHGIMRCSGVCIGIGFPNYSREALGEKVQVFGTMGQLTTLLENDGIVNGVEAGLFGLSVFKPREIDTESSTKTRFIISRDQNKNVMGSSRRRFARYNSRHPEQQLNNEDRRGMWMSRLNKIKELPFFIKNSNRWGDGGGSYAIYVEKVDYDDSLPFKFNSHGFGNAGGYVYDL